METQTIACQSCGNVLTTANAGEEIASVHSLTSDLCQSCKSVTSMNTDNIRRDMIANGEPEQNLAATTDTTYDTQALSAEFEVLGFAAPFVVVRRRSDDVKGSLEFTHSPRVYFNFRED